MAAIEGKQKAREKKKLKEMERTMKNDLRRTLSRESGGSGTVNRFSFQPEPEDVMIPPLRFTQVKNSWLLVPPTLPPLLPLTPLMESPPVTEPLYQCHPTRNQVQETKRKGRPTGPEDKTRTKKKYVIYNKKSIGVRIPRTRDTAAINNQYWRPWSCTE